MSERKGLLVVNTGDGKGKSTAAFGMALRAWGHGYRICVIQFMKTEKGRWGERKAAEKLGIEWHTTGDGFTWMSKNLDETAARAEHGWGIAEEKIASDRYDLIVLDEFTYPLKFGWLDTETVLAWIEENRPARLHLVVTGRDAPDRLLEKADLATEMKMVKHPFESGVMGQQGVEF
ncbi:MAG: cob(I)yrinic acid a,c-diamide adenosyltransferase [Anaerolineales bacterium]|nr:cob(I)yrinic acid a,c-diamide adenosyltransferase [Anaerolineales bacterium]